MSITSTLMKPTKTEAILISMLREEKGWGRRYGVPHWVGNQNRDFMAESRARVNFRWTEINYLKSVFHHLNDHLEVHEELSDLFHKLNDLEENQDEPWLVVMHDFLENLKETRDDYEYKWGDNTYNHENVLDQDIQYEYFLLNGDPFVILHIHNAEDIRSGYTTPYVFSVYDESFFLFSDGYIHCNTCDANWWSDDAYHWFFEGTCGRDYDHLQLEELLKEDHIDEEGNATCPICNTGRLTA